MQTELFLPSSEKNDLSVSSLVNRLKSENSDFEWYPTTGEMIDAVFNDLLCSSSPSDLSSVLDIGAGDGRVLLSLSEKAKNNSFFYHNGCWGEEPSNRFVLKAIEKAQSHVARFDDDIVFVGGDFFEANIGDKNADIIFCNPPYSDFELWSSTIISESFCTVTYLVLPSRWVKSEIIKSALKSRDKLAEVIYSGDFYDGDRKARARVDVIRITSSLSERIKARLTEKEKESTFLVPISRNSRNQDNGAFDRWFENNYPETCKKASRDKFSARSNGALNSINKGLIPIDPSITELVAFYDADMRRLKGNYDKLEGLDAELFCELEINLSSIKSTLRERIANLKLSYWRELFEIYSPIKEALTFKFRRILFEELNHLVIELDFNAKNALLLTNIVLDRANVMREKQIIAFYKELSCPKSVKMYKSNQRVFEREKWRYKDYELTNSHYQLDYRIIQHNLMGLYANNWQNSIDKDKVGLVLDDLILIAHLVGVPSAIEADYSLFSDVRAGDRVTIKFSTAEDEFEELVDLRFFQNGNVHLRMNKEFSLRLNVMVGKLLGWIHNPKQAKEELELSYEDADAVEKFYDELGCNLNLGFDSNKMLGISHDDY